MVILEGGIFLGEPPQMERVGAQITTLRFAFHM
jgi:hypothetical protein